MIFLEHEKHDSNTADSRSLRGSTKQNDQDEDGSRRDFLSSTLTTDECQNEKQHQPGKHATVAFYQNIKSVKEHAKKLNRLSTEFKKNHQLSEVAGYKQQNTSAASKNYVKVVPKYLEIESFNLSHVTCQLFFYFTIK
jgi:hypothetical protein